MVGLQIQLQYLSVAIEVELGVSFVKLGRAAGGSVVFIVVRLVWRQGVCWRFSFSGCLGSRVLVAGGRQVHFYSFYFIVDVR